MIELKNTREEYDEILEILHTKMIQFMLDGFDIFEDTIILNQIFIWINENKFEIRSSMYLITN